MRVGRYMRDGGSTKAECTYVLAGVEDRAALADEDVSGNDIFICDTATTR